MVNPLGAPPPSPGSPRVLANESPPRLVPAVPLRAADVRRRTAAELSLPLRSTGVNPCLAEGKKTSALEIAEGKGAQAQATLEEALGSRHPLPLS